MVVRPRRPAECRSRRLPLALVVFGALIRPLGAGAICVGDCPPTDGEVAVNELVTGVNIALGGAALAVCPDFDADASGTVEVGEVIVAVNNAQQGCGDRPTPTPSVPPTASGPTATPTVTFTPGLGPVIWYFGITAADDVLERPTIDGDIPVYQRIVGFGFSLVIEAARGRAGLPVETETFVLGGLPAVLVQVTRPLGNGSAEVCDNQEPTFGGVPAIDPPRFENLNPFDDAFNDFGCRFIDGTGQTRGRTCPQSCIRYDSGEFHCEDEDNTEWQFCGQMSAPLEFPEGDTLVSAQVRDVDGNLGPPKQLIIRIAP